jgi:hypothetical protein
MSTAGLRKASLALAAVHPRDRQWLLRRLPDVVIAAWREHGAEARVQVAADPAAALDGLMAWRPIADLEVPDPLTLVGALDRLPVAWAARSLAVVAPDHVEVYRAFCAEPRAAALRAEMLSGPKRLPPSLAHAWSDALKRLGAPDGHEGASA